MNCKDWARRLGQHVLRHPAAKVHQPEGSLPRPHNDEICLHPVGHIKDRLRGFSVLYLALRNAPLISFLRNMPRQLLLERALPIG